VWRALLKFAAETMQYLQCSCCSVQGFQALECVTTQDLAAAVQPLTRQCMQLYVSYGLHPCHTRACRQSSAVPVNE
jgi:hypothetical protein